MLTADAATNQNKTGLLVWLRDQLNERPGDHHIAHLLDQFQVKGRIVLMIPR